MIARAARSFERIGDTALNPEHFGDSGVAPSEIALEFDIFGVGSGQTLHDGEAGAVLADCSLQVALSQQHGADPFPRDRQISLKACIPVVRVWGYRR